MVYTAYTEGEMDNLPDYYKKMVVGVSVKNEICQVPLCPECGGEMMEIQNGKYLSCTLCGCIRLKRIIQND